MKTLNVTVKLKDNQEVESFLRWLPDHLELVSYQLLPENNLYETDPKYKILVKAVKSAKKQQYDYLNEIGYGSNRSS
jgi:hypothetical protein